MKPKNIALLIAFQLLCTLLSAQSPSDILKYKKQKQFFIYGKLITLNTIEVTNTYSNWSGLNLCWVEIPFELASFAIHDISRVVTTQEDFQSFAKPNDIIVINGGFFDKSAQKKPDGLVISDNFEISPFRQDWKSGGFLIDSRSGIQIWPVDSYQFLDFTKIRYCLQSKPIVVRNASNDIPFANNLPRSNRVGVGTTSSGKVLICAAVSKNPSGGLTFFELGEILSIPESAGGPGALDFIALDGGPSVSLYIPAINFYLGANKQSHIANIIRFIPKR